MGACLSRNSGSDNDFRNLNDSRHVMLLLAKKERKRDRALRRSISLSGHADTNADAGHHRHPAETPRDSHHTSTTATTNNSQRSVASLQRSDSHGKRSRQSLTSMKQPSARQSLIESQKELAKLDSYGEYIPPTAPRPTTTAGEEEPESTAAASQQAKAA